jgi:hypothetical protein
MGMGFSFIQQRELYMAKQKMTAIQRFRLEEQEELERAKRRTETRRQAAIELGEIVLDAGCHVLSPDMLAGLVRKALAERESAGQQPSNAPRQQRAKPASQGQMPLAEEPVSGREEDREPSAAAA